MSYKESPSIFGTKRIAIGPDRPFTKEDVGKTIEYRNGKQGQVFMFEPRDTRYPVYTLIPKSLDAIFLTITGQNIHPDDYAEVQAKTSPWDALYIIEPDNQTKHETNQY